MAAALDGVRPHRGRPRKFAAPSRAVTLTLPESVIAALGALDTDLSRAVARIAQPLVRQRPHAPAELAVFGRRAVIVVNPSRTLEQQVGVELVPLPDGRALISFDRSLTLSQLELMLLDALDRGGLAASDRRTFEAVLDILRSARRSPTVAIHQRNIIVLEGSRDRSRRPARSASPRRRTRRSA